MNKKMTTRLAKNKAGLIAKLTACATGCALALAAPVHAKTETLTPAIWIDPDGCEHWVIDDGAEGYMSPHLRRDGTPVCRASSTCAILGADLTFETDSSAVTKAGRAKIRSVISGQSATAYRVSGHADAQGSDEYNMVLSRHRADSVAQIVRSLGASVVEVKAFGERSPRASNDTESGRELNRRVEIQCIE